VVRVVHTRVFLNGPFDFFLFFSIRLLQSHDLVHGFGEITWVGSTLITGVINFLGYIYFNDFSPKKEKIIINGKSVGTRSSIMRLIRA